MNSALVTFFTVATAVVIEAIPFLIIGAFLSAILEIMLPPDRLARFIPKGRLKSMFVGLGAGMVLPTCECGVVPIVRRLMIKGVPPQIAITYLLAAPVINPLVLISTYVAFQGNLWMVLGRVLLVAVPAAVLGLITARTDPSKMLRDEGINDMGFHHHHHGCDHSHECECVADHAIPGGHSKVVHILLHTGTEFLDMARFLVLGALAAGFFKTLIPQEILSFFSTNIFLSVGAMMALAILLSVCSEADAFVAGSFVFFPPAARLSFVSIGPMVDLKLIGMYGSVFQRRVFFILLIVPTALVYFCSVFIAFLLE